MEQGTIASWHKKPGDYIEAGDLLFDVATDKATVEYNALDSGYLRKILIKDGGEAIVNQAIAIFTEKKDESIAGYEPEGIKAAQQEAPSDKETKKKDEQTPTPTTSQASAAPFSAPTMRQPAFTPEPPLAALPDSTTLIPGSRIKASPLAKKLAKQRGLDLSTVKGTGPGHRIVSNDLSKAQPLGVAAFGRSEQPTIPAGSYEEEPLTPIRKVIGQRLQEAKTYIPHFYVSLKVDAQPLINLREQLKNHNIKLTFNDFVIKACALTLRQHPNVNSGFNSVTNSIIRFKTIDISVAVSLPSGLITPIIRHADFKNLAEISLEVKALASRAKEGKLEPKEYKGGSFTISNLGMYGVSDFIAIINPPQAAILAISGIQQTPVIRDNQIVPGNEMTLTVSGDHRVIDGVAVAEFLKSLQKLLENPAVLLM